MLNVRKLCQESLKVCTKGVKMLENCKRLIAGVKTFETMEIT